MSVHRLNVGDKVIFAKEKTSLSPGKRAKEVSPAAKGDEYSYIVEKYWLVTELVDGNHARLVTRRGKEHTVTLDDPRLRRARWWERWLLRNRFPKRSAVPTATRSNVVP